MDYAFELCLNAAKKMKNADMHSSCHGTYNLRWNVLIMVSLVGGDCSLSSLCILCHKH